MNRELAKSKYRAVGSGALVLVAVAAFISFSAMMPSTQRALETMVEEQNISDFIVHVGEGDVSDTELVEGIQGVAKVDYRVTVSSKAKYVDADGVEQLVPSTLVGIEPDALPSVNTLSIKADDGTYFVGDGNGTVLMEGGFAYGEDISPGDSVEVQTSVGYVEYDIVGLAFSPEHIMMPFNPQSVIPLPGSLAIIYMPIDSLREAFGFPDGYINELLFLFDGTAEPDTVMNGITEALSADTITFTQQRDELYGYSLIKEDLEQGGGFTGAIALLILMAAFFVTYSFFSRVVDEERKQIGVMRALGYSRGSVLASYLYMASLIGLGGSIAGVLLGVPIGRWLAGVYIDMAIHGELANLVLHTDVVVLGLLFGPLTTGIACAIAVWGTVSMEPHEAIKDMRTQKVRRRRPEAARANRGHWISYITLYTLRSTFRHRRRTVFTVVAIGFSIVLGAMSFLMVESLANSISKSVSENENWDLVVDYSYPLNGTTAGAVTADGVSDRVQISKLAVVWQRDGSREQAMVTGLPAGQQLHEFALIDGSAASDSGEVMIGYAMSKDYGIETGDGLTLSTSRGEVELVVSGVLADTIGEIVVDMEVVDQLTATPVFAGMYVACTPGTEDQVISDLEMLPYIANVQKKDDIKSGIVEFMQSYNAALYAFSLVGVSIATLTIANVVFMGVLERQREYGQLRAVGYRSRDVSKSVVTEILAMIAMGSALAVPLVLLVLEAMVGMFREFWPTYSTVLYLQDWYGYVAVVLLTTVFGLLAAVPGIRFLSKMDIAKTVSGGRFG